MLQIQGYLLLLLLLLFLLFVFRHGRRPLPGIVANPNEATADDRIPSSCAGYSPPFFFINKRAIHSYLSPLMMNLEMTSIKTHADDSI